MVRFVKRWFQKRRDKRAGRSVSDSTVTIESPAERGGARSDHSSSDHHTPSSHDRSLQSSYRSQQESHSTGSQHNNASVFCGCCCDMRIAVICINLLNICLILCAILVYSSLGDSNTRIRELFFDHGISTVAFLDADIEYWWTILVASVATLCSYSGVFGALEYSRFMTRTALVYYATWAMFGIVRLKWVGALLACFFLYPHMVFLNELSNGIMSRNRYHRQQRCCCLR